MIRVAYFSPLPPSRSGIADYSAELLPRLAEHWEIELFVEDGAKVDRALADRFPVHGHRAFPSLAHRFDVPLYHLGNNADYHAGIYRVLLDHPGVVVLHEYVLHHLVRGMTLVKGDLAGYLEEVRYAYGRTGESLAKRNVERGVPLDVWSFPLFERAVDCSLGLIVHNDFTAQKVQVSRPDTRIALVPHHLSLGEGSPHPWPLSRDGRGEPLAQAAVLGGGAGLVDGATVRSAGVSLAGDAKASAPTGILNPDPTTRPLSVSGEGDARAAAYTQARQSLGIPENAFVVASFGFITPAKRLDVALRAFAEVKRQVPHAVYLLVGEVSPYYDFASVLKPELSPGVEVVGRTEIDRFLLYMQAVDVAVNLRHPTAGETSGTLIRLLGTGKPVIVSRNGAFTEIPDDCCAKVDLGEMEEELLAAYLVRLAQDEPLRRAMGENARRYTAAHHTLEGSARGYADFVRRIVEEGVRPFTPAPPLAPFPPEDLLSALVRDVSAETVDLGAGREDDLLALLAQTFVELGLDRPTPEVSP